MPEWEIQSTSSTGADPAESCANAGRGALTLVEQIPVTALRIIATLPGGDNVRAGSHLYRLCEPSLIHLRRVARQLQPEVDRAERDFLSLGVQLSRLSSVCTEVVRRGERLFALATGQEQAEEAVKGTMELLDPPLRFLEEINFRSTNAADAAALAAQAAERILNSEEALTRVMKPLAYIRTLFHIEASRLPGEVRQMFAALNAEIEALQERVRDQFSVKFRELRQMLAALRDLESERREEQQAIGCEGQKARERLNRSFQELQSSISENAERNAGLAHLVGDLSAGVDRMVVAMQTHDMFSQRIAHVRHAIDILEGDFAALQQSTLAQVYSRLPTFSVTANLQAAQVQAANTQLAEAAELLRNTVDQVLSKVHELDDDCLILRGFEHVTTAANGTIQILLDSIDETASLVTRATDAAEAYYRPLQPLGVLAAGLAGDIDDTGQRMHRIALNTQIIAVQQGEGTGLEALAGTMATTAAAVSHICESAAQELIELRSSLQKSVAGFGAIAATGSSLALMFQDAGEEHRRSLHALRDAALDALIDLGRTSEDARRVASGMKKVDLHDLCNATLPSIEHALRAIGEKLDAVCHMMRAGQIDITELAALKAQYTMRSERVVHAQSLGSDAEASAGEFGGDIELF